MSSDLKIQPTTVTTVSVEELETVFNDTEKHLNWDCVFVLPFWLKSWWNAFARQNRQMIIAVRSEASIIGIAPLMIQDQVATFLGSEAVCDYQDMILSDGCHEIFFSRVLNYLKEIAVRRVELGAIRPDSAVLHGLTAFAKKNEYPFECEPVDKIYEMRLPKTWQAYLKGLKGKQRHEVRRKTRRLREAGNVDYQVADNKDKMVDALDEFLVFFQASREDKAEFLTDEMAIFFRCLAKEMAERDMMQLGNLQLDGKTIASTFCFTYKDRVFLYNNGYDPNYRRQSAGLMSKIFSIQYNIEKKTAFYNFLKGDEVFKKRLGGQQVPLYRLTLHLNP